MLDEINDVILTVCKQFWAIAFFLKLKIVIA